MTLSPVIPRIVRKELIQTFRDRRMVMILLIVPVVQTTLFGFAVNLDLAAQPAVIADLDRTSTSREAARAIANDSTFQVVRSVGTYAAAEREINSGAASLAMMIPKGFEKDLAHNEAEISVVLDGSDANTALRAGQAASQILNDWAFRVQRGHLVESLSRVGLAPESVTSGLRIEARPWFNPPLKTAVFFVPAVLAMVLTVVTMMLTSMGLTREKEIGTLEQIMVSPVRPLELMAGKILPFALIGLLDVAVIVAAAALVFDVPVRGSITSLFFASGLFLAANLGLGLFISTISATQQQAMLNAFFVILPAVMLSGFVFPIDNMPVLVQYLTWLDPLRYYIELTRGIMVKGATLADLWRPTVMLALLGLALLVGSAMRFRKRVS